jgi:predicted nucleic acid-binding Zn ribbon protein
MEKAGDILKQLLDSKQRQNAAHYSSLFKGWESMVGAPICQHSWVKDIVNNILLVEVDHPGWMQMLFFKKRQILNSLKKAYPDLAISDISIRLGSARSERSEPEPAIPQAAEEGSVEVEIEEVVARVGETELKDKLKRLFVSAVKRGEKADGGGGRNHGG